MPPEYFDNLYYVWSHDRNCADHQEKIKRIGAHEGTIKCCRWQSVKSREISVFPLTKLIMDVPGTPPDSHVISVEAIEIFLLINS